MQNIGVLMRSKIPVFGSKSSQNEGAILLAPLSNQPRTKDYNTNTSEQQNQPDNISQCTSDNDLYDYNDKSNVNRINEWQAGYNVTNAIQVI